jgi:predicted amidohydrolase YtcJ
MLALAGSVARRVDLGGKSVTPGFNDAHSHPCESGVALLTQVALDMDSVEAITPMASLVLTSPVPRGRSLVIRSRDFRSYPKVTLQTHPEPQET